MSRMPERRPSIQVSDRLIPPSTGEQGCRILALPLEPVAQFDTMETRFFREGDELSTPPGAAESFDDPTSLRRPRHRVGKPVLWAAAAGATLALCAALGAWHMHRRALPADRVTPVTEAAPDPAPPAPATSAPAAPRSVLSPPRAAAGAIADKTDDGTFDVCKRAYDHRRPKEVLAACAQAFAHDPRSAEIAVMLAKTEFDRGRSRQALDWAKKAVALDENHADAYVFLGGAEQAFGHAAAARTAYKRYLQLSPQGRYAADLRAVLGSL